MCDFAAVCQTGQPYIMIGRIIDLNKMFLLICDSLEFLARSGYRDLNAVDDFPAAFSVCCLKVSFSSKSIPRYVAVFVNLISSPLKHSGVDCFLFGDLLNGNNMA